MIKCGVIENNEVWGGNIFVKGDIVIPGNVTVSIEPGSKVEFESASSFCHDLKEDLVESINKIPWLTRKAEKTRCYIFVQGTLRLLGDEDNGIIIGNKGWGGGIFFLSKERTVVSHCTIRNASVGIAGMPGSDLKIRNCAFIDNECAAIFRGKARVEKNAITGNGNGVLFLNLLNAALIGNTIQNNRNIGVLRVGGDALIARNTIRKNAIGINACHGKSVRVRDNTLCDNNLTFYATGIESCTMIKNRIENTTTAFLGHYGLNYVKAYGNSIAACTKGFEYFDAGEVWMEKNAVRQAAVGVSLQCRSKGTLLENDFHSIREVGIICGGISEVFLNRNRMKEVHKGIVCIEEARIHVADTLIESIVVAMECQDVGSLDVVDSVVSSGTDSGLCLKMSAHCSIRNSHITGIAGVELRENGCLSISGCTIKAVSAGLIYDDQSDGVVEGNKIEGTEEDAVGIDVGGICEVEIRGNEVKGVGVGVKCGEESEVRLEGNEMKVREGGVEASEVSSVDIARSRIRSEGECVRYTMSASGVVEGNDLEGEAGVEAGGSSQVRVVGNVMKVKARGVTYHEESGGVVEGNLIEGLGEASLELVSEYLAGNNRRLPADRGSTGLPSQAKSRDCVAPRLCAAAGTPRSSRLASDRNAAPLSRRCISKPVLGIGVNGIVEIKIKGNRMKGVELGIRCSEESEVRIEGGEIESSLRGVEVGEVSSVAIEGVRVKSGEGGCIRYLCGASGVVEGNDLEGEAGVEAGGSSQVRVVGNVMKVKARGVTYHEESGGVVEGNRIEGTEEDAVGIHIGNISEVDVKGNEMRGVEVRVELGDGETEVKGDRTEARQHIDAMQGEYGNGGDSPLLQKGVLKVNTKKKTAGDTLRKIVLSTWHYPLVGWIYAAAYSIAIQIIVAVLKHNRNIQSIYLRRGLTNSDWIPAASDIDLFLVIDELDTEQEMEVIRDIGNRYFALKKVFGFLGEMQTATKEELVHYLTYGDMKALEAPWSWRTLHGEPLPSASYFCDRRKFTCDAVTEILNGYRNLGDAFFNRKELAHAKELFLKSFLDILKYSRFIEKGSFCRFSGRRDVIDACEAEASGRAKELLRHVRRAWKNNGPLSDDLYEELYMFAFHVIEKKSRAAAESSVADRQSATAFAELSNDNTAESRIIYDTKRDLWNLLCDRVRRLSDGTVEDLFFDDPGLLYIIVGDPAGQWRDHAFFFQRLQKYFRRIVFTRETPVLILTRSMFQCLLMSLHLETPFNYYKLPCRGSGTVMTLSTEKRYHGRLVRSDFFRVNDDALSLLLEEMISLLSISLRTFETRNSLGSRLRFVYLYNRMLGIHLALEKKIIVEPYLDSVVKAYGQQYPEHYAALRKAVERYLIRTADAANACVSGESFQDNFPFLRDVLRRMKEKRTVPVAP